MSSCTTLHTQPDHRHRNDRAGGGESWRLLPTRDGTGDDGEIACWPSQPRYELIEDGEKLKASGINLESQWAKPWMGSKRKRLIHGTDYDLVVLGISIGALGSICRQLVKHLPKWRHMIEKVDTVATQAMQLWMSPTLSRLGWPLPSTLVVNYAAPAANWLDSSQVIPFEPLLTTDRLGCVFLLRAAGRAAIPAAGPSTFPEDQRRGVQQAHQRWIEQHAAHLWPALAADPGGRPLSSTGTCSTIRTTAPAPPGWIGSISARTSNRPTGSCFRRRARQSFDCAPDQSGVGNLYLAGDWTHNKFNGGCVEGTVMSGLLCSRAIAGYPRHIFGERPFGIFGV